MLRRRLLPGTGSAEGHSSHEVGFPQCLQDAFVPQCLTGACLSADQCSGTVCAAAWRTLAARHSNSFRALQRYFFHFMAELPWQACD